MAMSVIYGQRVDGSRFSVASVAIDDHAQKSPRRHHRAAAKRRVPVIPIVRARPFQGKRDGRDSAFGRPGHDEAKCLDDVVIDAGSAIDSNVGHL
jgi:hypothetical protein